mmetsp:Transcript_12993/g.27350  ORF Transcript_12993/g.27350 Transcript_12993/m.27350 type:complete len:252 (+) Transcript_12993:202-957(+)
MGIERIKGIRPTEGQRDHTAVGPGALFVVEPKGRGRAKHGRHEGQDISLRSGAPGGGRRHTRVAEGLGNGPDALIMDGIRVLALFGAKVVGEGKLVGAETAGTTLPSSVPGRSGREAPSSSKTPQVASFDRFVGSLQDSSPGGSRSGRSRIRRGSCLEGRRSAIRRRGMRDSHSGVRGSINGSNRGSKGRGGGRCKGGLRHILIIIVHVHEDPWGHGGWGDKGECGLQARAFPGGGGGGLGPGLFCRGAAD